MSKIERTKMPEVIAFAGPNGSGKFIMSVKNVYFGRGTPNCTGGKNG